MGTCKNSTVEESDLPNHMRKIFITHQTIEIILMKLFTFCLASIAFHRLNMIARCIQEWKSGCGKEQLLNSSLYLALWQ